MKKLVKLIKNTLPLVGVIYISGSVCQAYENLGDYNIVEFKEVLNQPDVRVGWIYFYGTDHLGGASTNIGARCIMNPTPGSGQRPRAELVRKTILAEGQTYTISFYTKIARDPNNLNAINPGGVIMQLAKYTNANTGEPNWVLCPQAEGGTGTNKAKGPYLLKNSRNYGDTYVEAKTSDYTIVDSWHLINAVIKISKGGAGTIKISIDGVQKINLSNLKTGGDKGAQLIFGCYNGGGIFPSWSYGENRVERVSVTTN